MTSKHLLPIILTLALLVSACANEKNSGQTATPEFLTATLPVTSTPEATVTPPSPTAIPTTAPIEGTTTTQVNVRAEPSTTSAVLGMIVPSAKVQVAGKDASGTWYQLIYPEGTQSKGWVIATYVQMVAGVEVPVIQVGAGPGFSASVLVLQQVNVRTGPGTQFETIGMLSPDDVVALTGRDPSGAWLQIEYAAGPETRGWINAEFVQASGAETVPVMSESSPESVTQSSAETQLTPPIILAPAFNDGDSADSPSIAVAFSPIGARTLQFSSDVSAPQGDHEDWAQFVLYGKQVKIQVTCSESSALSTQLLAGGEVIADSFLCGTAQVMTLQPGQTYLIHLAASGGDSSTYTRYTLKIEQLP